MSKDILMVAPYAGASTDTLEEHFTVHKLWKAKDPEAMLLDIKDRIQGVVSVYNAPLSGRLIRALPQLEIIAHFGAGYDVIDVEAVRERDIVVTYTPDIVTEETATMAMGLTLSVMRRLVEGDLFVRTGQWEKRGSAIIGRSLAGKVMGIVGMGRIGQAIATRAKAFGMKVVYNGPAEKKNLDDPYYTSLKNMAEISDVLVLACRYDETTHHLVDEKILTALGTQGVLVNIARGAVVKEVDLVSALQQGGIAGAGLDVFENEPHVPSTLLRMDNVVLQPHHGGGTQESRAAMAGLVLDNLKAYFGEGRVLTPISL